MHFHANHLIFLSGVFLTGLLGGLHCIGMCGGILTAVVSSDHSARMPRQLAIHFGRILSYAALGMLAGGVGGALTLSRHLAPIQVGFYLAANAMLLVVGVYLLGWVGPLSRVEALGGRLWRRLAPLTRPLIPARHVGQALALGTLWGFMPCGLVYGALTMAMLAGGPWQGAGVMLSFGLGTLPNLLGAALLVRRGAGAQRLWRVLAGAAVLIFGGFGLARAAGLEEQLRRGIALCVGMGT